MPEKEAVLLLAHGSPEKAEDVPAFMMNITGGRPVSPETMQEVAHRYDLIGRSPLLDHTRAQAQGLQRELGLPVYVGMRNWHPYIAEAVQQMLRDGVTRAAAICLAPHNSRTSVGLYKKSAFAEAGDKIKLEFVESWHDHPLLIQAFVEKLEPAWEHMWEYTHSKVPVIFTAHSVPRRTIEAGDPYEAQAKKTAALVAARLPEIKPWKFAFQSQGMSGGEWIGPTVIDTMLELEAGGHRAMLIQPVGFVCDHVEVLYDIDIGFQQFAHEQGIKLERTESLNASPTFAAALADLARKALAQTASSLSRVKS
ncbi:MAG TPA: ferrochelatase [Terriglobales bacterium]|jgi:ferrochelatase|nr:ferrochelatase [Terriglobales bacterium]